MAGYNIEFSSFLRERPRPSGRGGIARRSKNDRMSF
jgi:hypothetical protein